MTAEPGNIESTRAELFAEIADTAARALLDRGIGAHVAEPAAVAVCDAIADSFGGAMIYIPRGHARQLVERDAEIVRRSQAESAINIARAYSLSLPTVYKILRRAKARAAMQGVRE